MGTLNNTRNSNLFSLNDLSVLITDQNIYTPPLNVPEIVYNNSDTLIQLNKNDFNKIYIIDNTMSVRINLPKFLTTSDLGNWFMFHKNNVGDLSIYSTDDTKIETSILNGLITNNDSEQVWANVGLFLAKIDLWKYSQAPLGNWTII